MKTIFKKTLVAVALAGLSANAVAAADVSGSTVKVTSKQGAIATVTAPATIQAVLGAEYAVGDIITFSFTAGTLKPATVANQLSVTLPDNNDVMTLGLLEATESSAKYRVTVLNKDGNLAETTAGGIVTLASLTFTGSAVRAADGVTFSYAAVTGNGLSLDSTGSNLSKKIIYVGDELNATVGTPLNRKIDVTKERKFFTATAPADVSDALILNSALVTTVNTGTVAAPVNTAITDVATLTRINYVVKGDFSWVVDTDADTAGIQQTTAVVLSNCAGAAPTFGVVTVTATQASFACNVGNAATSVTLNVDQGGAAGAPAALSPATYTADATFVYTNVGGTTGLTEVGLTDAAAGSWTLNGSTVNVPYMVYGSLNGLTYGQIVNVTNTSAVEGDISVDVWAEDGTVLLSNEKVGVAKKNSTVSVASAIRNALKDKKAFENGKVSIRVVTNVPDTAVTVYSAYVDAGSRERAIVNNDSKVQTK